MKWQDMDSKIRKGQKAPLAGRNRPSRSQADLLRAQEGITLLEMTIVVFVLALLSTLVVGAVTGRSTESRDTAVINDLKEVQNAVDGFAAAHPAARYPTQDGCLPGEIFIAETPIKDGACEKGPNPGPFNVNNSATWRAIIWERGFKTRDSPPATKTFTPHFLQQAAKHGFEHNDGTPWPTTTVTIVDPASFGGLVQSVRVPDINGTAAWVLDRDGVVHVTIPSSAY